MAGLPALPAVIPVHPAAVPPSVPRVAVIPAAVAAGDIPVVAVPVLPAVDIPVAAVPALPAVADNPKICKFL